MLFSRCCSSCTTSFERHLLYLPSRTPHRPKTQDHIRSVSTKRFMRNFDASLTTVLNRRSSRTPSSLKKATPSSSSTSTSRYINHVGSDTTNYISNTDSLSEDTGKGTSSNRKPPVITPSVVGQHSSKDPPSIQNIDTESSISSPHHRILHSQVGEPEEGYWLSFRPGVELTKSMEDKFDDWFAKNIWEEGKLSSWAKEMRVVRGQSNKVLIQWHSLDDCKRAKIVYNPYRRLMHCDFQASLWPLHDYYTSTLEIFGLSELDEVESVRNQFPYLSGSKETQIKGWEGGGSKK
ncbi:hypothetical protein BT69DRAFT_577870 [Atractiella rhizophila]|nr:hypothetical protein BT69DRAFT_577870 [Atractiella rhizophila]